MNKKRETQNTIKRNIVSEYIRNHKEYPNQTLAKLILKKEVGLFSSVDTCRSYIRCLKGAKNKERKLYTPEFKEVSNVSLGLQRLKALQEKNKHEQEPNIILKAGKYGVLSDIHFPFQDDEALQTAINYLSSITLDGIILNGDIIDCYAISRFAKDRRDVHLFEEIELCKEFLNVLQQIFPDVPMWFKNGNHDLRVDKFIINQAPELIGLDEIALANLLHLKELDIVHVKNAIIKAGKLNILHGHEFGESIFSPVNPARGVFLKSKSSTLIGHYHQSSYHPEGNLNGDLIGCWSAGCLCKLSPSYRPFAYTKWNHGFAVVDVFEDGNFEVNNHVIINGKIR